MAHFAQPFFDYVRTVTQVRVNLTCALHLLYIGPFYAFEPVNFSSGSVVWVIRTGLRNVCGGLQRGHSDHYLGRIRHGECYALSSNFVRNLPNGIA